MKKSSKNKKWLIAVAVSAPLMLAGVVLLQASDHGDAPAVAGKSTDITDLYAFQSPSNSSNLVLIGNVQGLLSLEATKTAAFDENTLIEFKIDNNNDFVEDLVIQCVAKDGKMYMYGPVVPKTIGAKSTVSGSASLVVDITPYESASPKIATSDQGISVFAGPRDDPFFFDLPQYLKVVTGVADHFNNPGSDALAGTNVLSVVVELPKTLLKGNDKINVWLETKQKG